MDTTYKVRRPPQVINQIA